MIHPPLIGTKNQTSTNQTWLGSGKYILGGCSVWLVRTVGFSSHYHLESNWNWFLESEQELGIKSHPVLELEAGPVLQPEPKLEPRIFEKKTWGQGKMIGNWGLIGNQPPVSTGSDFQNSNLNLVPFFCGIWTRVLHKLRELPNTGFYRLFVNFLVHPVFVARVNHHLHL